MGKAQAIGLSTCIGKLVSMRYAQVTHSRVVPQNTVDISSVTLHKQRPEATDAAWGGGQVHVYHR